jgi:membrane protease YdiL (CAAX protease family)
MDEQQNPPRLRVAELILVTGLAFAGPIFAAIYRLITRRATQTADTVGAFVYYGLIDEVLVIALLAYVLFRQGRGLQSLGLRFRWPDIPISLLLAFASIVAYYIGYALLLRGRQPVAEQMGGRAGQTGTYLDAGLTLGPILFVLLNPFFEELIARAYVMSEVKDLTGSGVLAVVISVALQTVYHLYQGVTVAIATGAGFLIFSLYYVRSRRITPVILAHLYLDALALWYTARQQTGH